MTRSLNKPKLGNLANEIWKSAERLRGEVLAKRPKLTPEQLAKLVTDLELNPKQSPLSNQTNWTLRKVYEEDHTMLEENFRVNICATRL